MPRDDVPAAVKAFDGVLLGSKRLKARPADKRAAVAPDRSDRSSYAVNQRLAACATGLDVARECAAQTKGGAPLSGVNVATALQRIAKLEARRTKRDDRVDKAFHVLAKEAARQAQDGAPRELANILWALAKFKLTEAAMPEVFDALSQACAAKAPAFNAQDVSNTAWAWATAGATSNQAGWDALAAHAPSKIESFDQRALSLTAWAFATSGVAAPPLFEAIAQAAPARMARDEFDAQGYANTVLGRRPLPSVAGAADASIAIAATPRPRRPGPSPRPATRPARPAVCRRRRRSSTPSPSTRRRTWTSSSPRS